MASKLRLQALEPRVLLDAAGMATAAETVVADSTADAVEPGAGSSPEAFGAFMAASNPSDPAVPDTDVLPPVISAGSDRRTTEDTSLSLGDISVSDNTDGDTVVLTIKLSGDNNNFASDAIGQVTFGDSSDVTLNRNGNTLTLSGAVNDINQTLKTMQLDPGENYNGGLSLEFSAVDKAGNTAELKTLDIDVVAVNDAPTLGSSSVSVDEGGAVSFGGSFDFSDPDIGSGNQQEQQMIVKVTGLPAKGTLTFNGSKVVEGSTFSYDQLSQLNYQHDGSNVSPGDTDGFTVTINDGAGQQTGDTTININLNPVNDAPDIGVVDRNVDHPYQGSINAPGLTVYEGTSSPLGLKVTDIDDNLDNSTITLGNLSDTLKAEGQLFLDMNGDGIFTAGTDQDLSGGGSFNGSDLGKLTYSHNGAEPNTAGDYSFTLSVTDSGGGQGSGHELTVTKELSLNIEPVDDDPTVDINPVVLPDDQGSIVLGSGSLDATDPDNVDANLVYTLEQTPQYGHLQLNIGGTWFTLTQGTRFTQEQINTGQVRYIQTQGVDQPTTDSIRFSLRDSVVQGRNDAGFIYGGVKDTDGNIETQTLQITVNRDQGDTGGPGTGYPVLQPTVPENNSDPGYTMPAFDEGGSVVIEKGLLDYTFKSSDGTYTVPPAETVYTLTRLPANGVIKVDGKAIGAYGTFTQDDINQGRVTFEHNGSEDHISSFSYTVGDGSARTATEANTGEITLKATPINDAPTAHGGVVDVIEQTNTGKDGIVNLTDKQLVIRDPDGSLDQEARVGEGLEDSLWFRVSDLPDDGSLQYWDGDSWEAVTANMWLSTDVLKPTADGQSSGLRYVHAGGDAQENLTDGFKFVVRDDLTAPADGEMVRSGQTEPGQGHFSQDATVRIDVAAFNDAPIETVNNELVLTEGDKAVITADSHLGYSDSDNNTIQRQYRLTEDVQNGKLYLNGKLLGRGSTFTQSDIDSGRLSYEHDGSETQADSFKFIVSDGAADAAESTFNIVIRPGNDFATIDAPDRVDGSGQRTIDFTGNNSITIGDVDLDQLDAGETDELTVTLALVSSGTPYAGATLSVTNSPLVQGNGTNSITITGTKAQVQSLLDSLQLTSSQSGNGDDGGQDKDTAIDLQITVDDRLSDNPNAANGGEFNDGGEAVGEKNAVTKTVEVLLSSVNDKPDIIVAPGTPVTVNEDASHTFGNLIRIQDPDIFDKYLTVKLSVGEGTLTLPDSYRSMISEGANGSQTLTLIGNASDINHALAELQYQGNENFNGSDALTVEVEDTHASGDALTDTEVIAIEVAPVNDAPVLDVPGKQYLDSGTKVTFGKDLGNAIVVSDPADSGYASFTGQAKVTVSINDPGALLNLGSAVDSSLIVTGNGTTEITLQGSIDQINKALDGLSYTASNPDSDQSFNLKVTVDDLNNGGANDIDHVEKQIAIDVSNTNDAPVITIGDGTKSVNEDSTLDLSLISVNDPDSFDKDITVSLTPKNGTVSIDGQTGTADSPLVLRGTQAEVNALLAKLQFTPTKDFHGQAQIEVTVDDLGNVGAGSARQDSAVLDITVDPVNDRPTLTKSPINVDPVNEDSTTVDQGGNVVIQPGSATELVDLLGNHFSDDTDDQSGTSGGGNTETPLSYVAIVGNFSSSDQGQWYVVIDGKPVQIPQAPAHSLGSNHAFVVPADAEIIFKPAENFHGTPGKLTVRVADGSSNLETSYDSDTGHISYKNLNKDGGTGKTGSWAGGHVEIRTQVENVNDKPAGTDTSMPGVSEDLTENTIPGHTVQDLFGPVYNDNTDNQTGITGGSDARTPLGGIAITGNTHDSANGRWQYSTDGGQSWQDIPVDGSGNELSDDNAILLDLDDKLRFVPATDQAADIAPLEVRLSDQPVMSADNTDIGSTGQTDHWSDTIELSTSVIGQNDKPVLEGTATNPVVTENQGYGTGSDWTDLVADGSASVTDPDFDNPSFGGGIIEVRLGNSFTGDQLRLSKTFDSVQSSDYSNGVLTIQLNSKATASNVEAILESIQYRSTSDNPDNYGTNTERSYEISLTSDGNNDGKAGGPNPLGSDTTISGTITIKATNDAPEAFDNLDRAEEDSTTPVTGNIILDRDSNGQSDNDLDNHIEDLSVDSIKAIGGSNGTFDSAGNATIQGKYGSLTINKNGTYSYQLDNSLDAVQKLLPGDELVENFEYTISDGQLSSNTAELMIVIDGTNDAPIVTGAVDGQQNHDGQQVTPVDVSGVFSDVDQGDSREYSASNLPEGLSINPLSGVISGTLAASASQRSSDTVVVTMTDGEGESVSYSFEWSVENLAPEAANDTAEIIENNASIDGNVITNSDHDTAPDSDPLTVVEVGAGNSNTGTVGGATTGSYGQLTLNSDGSYSYQLDNSNADVQKLAGPTETLTETFTYKVSDGNGGFDTATLTITIRGTNDAPIVETALGDQSSTDGQSGVAVDISTGFSDYDQGDQLTFSAANLPPGLSINDQGMITGTLDPSASQGGTDGSYSVTITATDKQGLTVQQTFNWKVVNLDPQATDDAGQVTEDGNSDSSSQTSQSTTGNVIDNDADTGPDSDPLTIIDTDTGNHSGQYGELTLNQDGSYSYTLNNSHPAVQALAQGQTLTERFSYTVSDRQGGTATATLVITVNGTNDAPDAVADSNSTNEDTAITKDNSGSVLTNDTDIDNNATKAVSKVTNSEGDTATPGETIRGNNGGRFTLHEDGTYDFDSGNDFQDLQQGEQRTTEVEYTVTDEHGATSTAKLVITVGGVNDAPTAGDLDNQTHNDGDTINLDVSDRFSDVDTSDTLTYSLADGSDALPQGLTLNADGTITGTIDRNASQVNGGQYSITVRASDGQGGHVDQTFSWTVNNPAPEAGNDTAEIIENSASIDGNVITNSDKDAAPDSDPLTVVEVGAGNSNTGTVGGATTGSYGQLTLNSDGSYSYQLDNSNADVQKLAGPTETLTETFTYKVSDGNGGFDTATLTITIRGTNDAPIVETALGDQSSTDGQSGVAVDISTGFSDYDQGDQLTFSAANLPPGLSISDKGLITGTLDPS
ncbi:Ig-like domain-containing protein, partial [Endozoicomonadaceae bacterium StTr2]